MQSPRKTIANGAGVVYIRQLHRGISNASRDSGQCILASSSTNGKPVDSSALQSAGRERGNENALDTPPAAAAALLPRPNTVVG